MLITRSAFKDRQLHNADEFLKKIEHDFINSQKQNIAYGNTDEIPACGEIYYCMRDAIARAIQVVKSNY
jgi:hypothetical protein